MFETAYLGGFFVNFKVKIMKKKRVLSKIAIMLVLAFAMETVGLSMAQAEEISPTSAQPVVQEVIVQNKISESVAPAKEELNSNKTEEVVVDDQKDEENNDKSESQKESRDFKNIVKQTTEYTCGPAALATLINLMGGNADEMQLAKLSGTTEEKGTTMLGLKKAAKELGYNALGKKVSFSKLKDARYIYLAQTISKDDESGESKDHFLIVKKYEDKKFYIADPVEGNTELTQENFKEVYKGSILKLEVTKNSQVLDPISGETVAIKDLSRESVLEIMEDMTDEEMEMQSGKFAALLRLLPTAVRLAISKTGLSVTKSFVSDLIKHPDRLKAYLKIGDVFKKGKTYYDVSTKVIVKIYDDYLIMYGKDSKALVNAYKVSSQYVKNKLKDGTWIKK